NPEQVDDSTIPDSALLWRFISPQWYKVDDHGAYRVSSGAFQDSTESGATSFVLADEVLKSGRSIQDKLAGKKDFGLVALSAGTLRELGLNIVRNPTENEEAHILVFGKKTGSIKNRMRDAAKWVVRPDQRNLP
ncbi:MAG TPA: hypothetical protein VH744_11395, partial [Terriglobales bacterium]